MLKPAGNPLMSSFGLWIKQNRREFIILAVIVLIAALLRLTRLGYQSEWNDEALSVTIASGTARQILTNEFHSLHPPGYYLILHFWCNLFGDSDFALRLPSALMGIGAVISMDLLGKSLFNWRTGLWAAALTALMPFHLYYSQEMRMYSQLFLLSSLVILCQVQLWRQERRIWWVLYLLVALLGLYTHYLFTLIIGTLGLFFIVRRWLAASGPTWKDFFLTHLLMGVLYLPIILWLSDQLNQSSDYWIRDVSLGLFLSMPLAFTVGQFLDFLWLQIGYALILMLVIITLLQAGRALAKRRTRAGTAPLVLTLMIYWLPVLIMFGVSIFWTPLTLPRLMIIAVPGLYLLLAWGASVPREQVVNAILVILLMGMGLLADYNWLFNPAYSKPPAREAALFLQAQASPDETIVYTNDSGFRLFWRYSPQLTHRLFLEDNDNPQVRPDVIRLMGGDIITFADPLSETFWLVLHQDFEAEEQEALFHRFDERYTRLAGYEIGGIRLYHYRASADMTMQ
jgi:mannosyltransferase